MNRAILVKSCQKNRARQQACMATWAAELRRNDGHVFFVEGGQETIGVSMDLERFKLAITHGDAYGDNSIKVREAIRLIAEIYRNEYDGLFICDDDTFVHPQRWLAHEPAGEFECWLHRPTTDREVKLNSGRPWANGGAGWWMSRRVCELYVNEVTERCSWDDVLATRIAQDHGIEISDRPDLYGDNRYSMPGDKTAIARHKTAITCHPVEPAEMTEMWGACRGA